MPSPLPEILTALGILLLSVVMLKGVGKGAAILGIVTGAIGIVFEALRPLIGMAYAVYGLLLLAWFIVAGWKLFEYQRSSAPGGRIAQAR